MQNESAHHRAANPIHRHRMTLTQFIYAVDNLVREWATDEPKPGAIPRDQLRAIYHEVCEQAVKECADWQEQRDKALEAIHKHYLEG